MAGTRWPPPLEADNMYLVRIFILKVTFAKTPVFKSRQTYMKKSVLRETDRHFNRSKVTGVSIYSLSHTM